MKFEKRLRLMTMAELKAERAKYVAKLQLAKSETRERLYAQRVLQIGQQIDLRELMRAGLRKMEG